MVKRAVVWLALAGVALIAAPARAAEAPTAEAIRAAAEAVRPAVVGIEVKRRQAVEGLEGMPLPPFILQPPREGQPRQWQWEFQLPPREGQDPWRQWPFQWVPREGEPRIFQFDPGRGQRVPQRTTGTGLIVQVEGDRGLVAAPDALVSGAEEVMVTLAEGRTLAAKLLGSDKQSGVGCLEIRGGDLKAVRPAKPEAVRLGDWVLAVGGPKAGAITVGIVSATDRPGPGDMVGARLLQTDAIVTEASAGGPLVNLQGEAVGMTLPLAPAGRGPQLTSVQPIRAVQATVAELAAKGKVARGWLGIMFQPLAPEVREQLGIDHGVQVVQVVEDQPAARAGIRDGDILLELGGRKVADTEEFRARVAALKPGATVPVKVLRGRQELELKVVLGERTEEGGEPALPRDGEKLAIGVTVQPLTPELAAQFGFERQQGLLVTAVEPGSPATRGRPAPISRGDLITEIDRKRVTTAGEAQEALKRAKEANAKTALLLVRGREETRYIVVDLPR